MIACSLNTAELAERREQMRRVALIGARVQLRFPAAARAEVEDIVEAESRCCPFLTMQLADDGGEVVLAVEAPQGAELVLAGMVEAFAG